MTCLWVSFQSVIWILVFFEIINQQSFLLLQILRMTKVYGQDLLYYATLWAIVGSEVRKKVIVNVDLN